MNPGVSASKPTLTELLTGLMHEAVVLLRQEVALATHELRAALRHIHIIVAVLLLAVGGQTFAYETV
jgi:hypothetical protein